MSASGSSRRPDLKRVLSPRTASSEPSLCQRARSGNPEAIDEIVTELYLRREAVERHCQQMEAIRSSVEKLRSYVKPDYMHSFDFYRDQHAALSQENQRLRTQLRQAGRRIEELEASDSAESDDEDQDSDD